MIRTFIKSYVNLSDLVINYEFYVETTKSLAFSPALSKALLIAIDAIAHGGRLLTAERELHETLFVGFSSISFSIKFSRGYSMNDHIKSVKDRNIL